jgi:hypothetical protein
MPLSEHLWEGDQDARDVDAQTSDMDDTDPAYAGRGVAHSGPAQVRDDGSVARVWARVFAPSFAPPESTDGGIPVIEVPEEDLTAAGDDVYQAEYAGFTENGVYQVVVYAADDEGNAAMPRWVFAGETVVYLPLVLR